MDLKEVGRDARKWMDLAKNRGQWRADCRAVMYLLKIQLVSQLAGSHLFLEVSKEHVWSPYFSTTLYLIGMSLEHVRIVF